MSSSLDDLIDGGGCGQVPGGEIILSALLELDLTPSRPGHLSGHPPQEKHNLSDLVSIHSVAASMHNNSNVLKREKRKIDSGLGMVGVANIEASSVMP